MHIRLIYLNAQEFIRGKFKLGFIKIIPSSRQLDILSILFFLNSTKKFTNIFFYYKLICDSTEKMF